MLLTHTVAQYYFYTPYPIFSKLSQRNCLLHVIKERDTYLQPICKIVWK